MDSNVMIQSFLDGMLPVINIMAPYFITMFVGYIVIKIIKKIVHSITYDFHIISGDSKRIARKKARKAEDVVDVISSVNDINNLMKK